MTPMDSSDRRFLSGIVCLAFALMFGLSILRHHLLQSNLFDLGIFDQGVFLISQGIFPYINTLGFHVLGDHAAVILYPLAMLYRVIPSVHWLLLIQALALAVGAIPVTILARDAGLDRPWARATAVSYLLFPALLNASLFDFHPEVLAVPALLWAVLSARRNRPFHFGLAILLALSTKAVVSLTVLLLGVWLLFVGKRAYGVVAALAGASWYAFAAYVLIPAFSSRQPAALGRYSHLGGSLNEITWNLFTRPQVLLGHLAQPDVLLYGIGLIAPVVIALSWRRAGAMIPALAMLLLNVLSQNVLQRNLVHHYALTILPFVFVWLVDSLGDPRLRSARPWLAPRWLMVSSFVAFLALAKFGYFFTLYQTHRDNEGSVREAFTKIQGLGSVLAPSHLCSHLSRRPWIDMTDALAGLEVPAGRNYAYVLLDRRHPGWRGTPEYTEALLRMYSAEPNYRKLMDKDGVVLFARRDRD